jgi:hypothetical protein
MYLEIDHKKSIEVDKIIFKESIYEKIILLLFYYIMFFVFPINFIYLLYLVLIENRFNGPDILFLMVLCFISSISFFLFIKWLSILNVKRINGENLLRNRDRLKRIIEKTKWTIIRDNTNYIIASKPYDAFSWGKQLTIIYDESDILINVISFGLFDIILPTHYISNKNEIKTLEELFLVEKSQSVIQ